MTRRFSAYCFVRNEADKDSLIKAAESLDVNVEVIIGTSIDAAKASKTWRIIPDILIVDCPGNEEDVFSQLNHLAHELPESDINVAVIGDMNDVNFSRKLRKEYSVIDYAHFGMTNEVSEAILAELIRYSGGERKRIDDSKVTLVTGVRRGVGVSTISSMIASTYASLGKKVVLVDLDLDSGVQYLTANGDPSTGYGEAMNNADRIDATLVNSIIKKGDAPWDYVSMNGRNNLNPISEVAVQTLLYQLTTSYQRVVIDLPRNDKIVRSLMTTAQNSYVVSNKTLVGLTDSAEFFASHQVRNGTRLILNDPNNIEKTDLCLSLKNFEENIPCAINEIRFNRDVIDFLVANGVISSLDKPTFKNLVSIIGEKKKTGFDLFSKIKDIWNS